MKRPPDGELRRWLGTQRWFGARDVDQITIDEFAAAPVEEGLEIAWWIVTAHGAHGPSDWLLAMARCQGAGPIEEVIRADGHLWFDALAHPVTAAHAVAMLGTGRHASLTSTWQDDEPLQLDDVGTQPRDQSNTTLTTSRHVLKVFRRLHPGRNPEIDIGAALRAAGNAHVPALVGWATLRTGSGEFDLLAVHRHVSGKDGFSLAVADAARFADGAAEQHFPGSAYELGIALGAVHADLGTALGEHAVPGYGADLSRRLLARLEAVADLTQLTPYLDTARTTFEDLAGARESMSVQRIHGDLHLGQTLFGDSGWALVDFEGEPRRPLTERSAPETVMRDIAGVLRSFDYAARWNSGSESLASEWASRNCRMFLEGYHLQQPDAVHRRVLDALVLDKALYEVAYEATYRPERIRIPLAAVAALCGR
ncbi:hypothetical protein [Cumulibacter soli]|uniref:hypothetical protein n=1 Tax=Cumulibacter soli TaxID=2546344 RepID=UPI0010681EF1|nr:hypothetical protein [Cumulibacter soli]